MSDKKIIISTQMPDQFEKLKTFLEDKVELINVPMIKVEPVEEDLKLLEEIKKIENYNWLIFTSKRGVEHFFILYKKTGLTRDFLKNIRFACIGQSTENEINNNGYKAHYVNPGKTSKDFGAHLIKEVLLRTDKILLPVGNLANDYLPEALSDYCSVCKIIVYNTIGLRTIEWETLKIIDSEKYDLLVFTSPSAFENFVGITGSHPLVNNLKIASIGDTTNESIEEEGFKALVTASTPNMEVLAKDILTYLGIV